LRIHSLHVQNRYLFYYKGKDLGETVRCMIDALLTREMKKKFNIIGTLGTKYSFKEVLLAPVQIVAMQLHPGATHADVQQKVRNYLKGAEEAEVRRAKRADDKARKLLLEELARDEYE